MSHNLEIGYGARNHQVVIIPNDNNHTETHATVTMDLMKADSPIYSYSIIETENRNHIKVLHCHVGGRRVERGIIQTAKVFHRANNRNIEGLCFRNAIDDNEEPQFVAIKSLRKSVIESYLQNGGRENPYTELQCMLELGDDVHVLKCIEVLQDEDFIHIIMPYCSEGSLMDNIPGILTTESFHGANCGFAEEVAKTYFHQILQILQYLRDNRICHRDISLGNLMLYKGRVVLIDFAMSLRVQSDAFGRTRRFHHQGRYGTFPYQAPEVFFPNTSFDGFAADLWSAAMVLYSMLTGKIMYSWPSPSDINFRFFLLAKGLSANHVNPLTEEIWSSIVDTPTDQDSLRLRIRANHEKISSDAMDLLENLLTVRPSGRWSLEQAINSAWLGNREL